MTGSQLQDVIYALVTAAIGMAVITAASRLLRSRVSAEDRARADHAWMRERVDYLEMEARLQRALWEEAHEAARAASRAVNRAKLRRARLGRR